MGKEEGGQPARQALQELGTRSEDQEKGTGEKEMHDLGARGRSQRPSGTKDASATTGVDPQDPLILKRRIGMNVSRPC
ncbi:hypothetical protein [Streptomyces virginiae]|uniref:hypothetical protein n=1 Tax=Streptomyces virginiae TaxID=1961 RepID=UPI003245F76C